MRDSGCALGSDPQGRARGLTGRALALGVIAVFTLLAALGCVRTQGDEKSGELGPNVDASSRPSAAPHATKPLEPAAILASAGDAAHGKQLVTEYECNRCHDGTEDPTPRVELHCVNCHKQILAGTFPATREKLARWSPHVRPVRTVPSLTGIGARLRRRWIAEFLLEPHDIRPLLEPTMPRLPLTPADARDIATYLAGAGGSLDAQKAGSAGTGLAGANAEHGRRLLEERACGSCHRFSGVPALPQSPDLAQAREKDVLLLAPDLRHARDRWSPEALVAWLRDPKAIKADTLMPPTGFTESDARDVAEYLISTAVAPEPAASGAKRLPLLDRAVTFAEVDEKVLRVTCRHCHSNPDDSLGDGGPGNTGGLGFKGRGIDFSSYRAVMSGYKDHDGERRSLFERATDKIPHLVLALLARQDEEAGRPSKGIQGMPLGLPALSSEQIQLVDSWIAQGRPR